MKIKDYIQDLLRERLASTECLVLYDPDARYRALAMGLVNEQCQVVDGSFSTIQAQYKPGNRRTIYGYLSRRSPTEQSSFLSMRLLENR
jgi:pantothenate kinase type III